MIFMLLPLLPLPAAFVINVQLFADFAYLVDEQQEVIDNIAHNISQASNYVEKARQNLAQARKFVFSPFLFIIITRTINLTIEKILILLL